MIMLRDVFVNGVANEHLGERLLTEDATTLTSDAVVAKSEACERAQAERGSTSQPAASLCLHLNRQLLLLLPSPRVTRHNLLPLYNLHGKSLQLLTLFTVVVWATWPILLSAQLELLCVGLWEGRTLLAHRGALVHSDGRPEVRAVNVELHEITFTRRPRCFLWYDLSCGKALELVSHIAEINSTPLKCMVGTELRLTFSPRVRS